MNVYIWTDQWAPGKNTVAYYPLTSKTTVNDQSGNNRNLTNYNGVAFGTYAGVDCASFYGNKMILYNSDFPARGYGDYTISCWMYTTSNNSQVVLANGTSEDNVLMILMKNGYIDPNIAPVTLNVWHHICYVIDSNHLIMYVDGVQVYNVTYSVNGGKSLGIGRETYDDDSNYLGYINEVIIESVARSAQEVQSYYNQTKSKYIGQEYKYVFDFQNNGLLGCTLNNTQYFGYEAGQGIYASTGSTDISIGCNITLPSNAYGKTLKSVELEVYYPSGGYGNAFGIIVNNGYSFRYSREENRNQQVNTREYVGFADGKTSPYYNVGTKSGELVLTYNFTSSTISGEIGGTPYSISDSYANTFVNSFADGTFRLLIVTWFNPNRAYIRKATIITNA